MSTTLPPRGAKPIEEEGNSKGQFTIIWWGWFSKLNAAFSQGFTGTVVTAQLTPGGTTGSMQFLNGIVVSQTAAT